MYFRPEADPIFDADRQTIGVIVVFQDVTQLRQQAEIKRGVISTGSHQLKTPLTSIRMAIHLVLDEKVGPLTDKQAELLLAAREDSDRLNDILDRLLDISRIESGNVPMELESVSPAVLISEAVRYNWQVAAIDSFVLVCALCLLRQAKDPAFPQLVLPLILIAPGG